MDDFQNIYDGKKKPDQKKVCTTGFHLHKNMENANYSDKDQ